MSNDNQIVPQSKISGLYGFTSKFFQIFKGLFLILLRALPETLNKWSPSSFYEINIP